MTLAEQIEYQPLVAADTGCLAAVPAHVREAANDNRRIGIVGHVGPEVTNLPIRTPLNFDHLPRVIALSGAAGSGKSTVSDFLAVRFGYRKTKFAAPLKDMLRALGLDDRHIDGDLKETPIEELDGLTPRYAMQQLGETWGRKCMGDDFWVNRWRGEALRYPYVVVDDTRYANEAALVRRMGGRVIRLVGRGGIAGNHASEQVNFIADDIIENTGSMEDLKHRVLEVMDGWRVEAAS